MKYYIQYTGRFKKDLKLAKKQGRDLDKLFSVVEILARVDKLEDRYLDHGLTGKYRGTRECHIEPDWLLIYEIMDDKLILMLNRMGSHSDLFK